MAKMTLIFEDDPNGQDVNLDCIVEGFPKEGDPVQGSMLLGGVVAELFKSGKLSQLAEAFGDRLGLPVAAANKPSEAGE